MAPTVPQRRRSPQFLGHSSMLGATPVLQSREAADDALEKMSAEKMRAMSKSH